MPAAASGFYLPDMIYGAGTRLNTWLWATAECLLPGLLGHILYQSGRRKRPFAILPWPWTCGWRGSFQVVGIWDSRCFCMIGPRVEARTESSGEDRVARRDSHAESKTKNWSSSRRDRGCRLGTSHDRNHQTERLCGDLTYCAEHSPCRATAHSGRSARAQN